MATLQAKNDKVIIIPIVKEEKKQEGSIIITGGNERQAVVRGSVYSVGLEIADKANLKEGDVVLYSNGVGLKYEDKLIIAIYDVLAVEGDDE